MTQLSSDDKELSRRLETLDWPPSDFNHGLHIQLAYIFLCRKTQREALDAMRNWTFRYLDHYAIDPSKYNETLTQAWMLAVRHFMARTPGAKSSEEFVGRNPSILDSKIMMTHYSRELLFSEKAKTEFVEPDLEPIPRYPDIGC